MTILNRGDRTQILARALKHTFEPRFAAILEACKSEALRKLKEDHPRFVELRADPEAAKYLQAHNVSRFCFESDGGLYTLSGAVYGRRAEMPVCRYPALDDGHVRFEARDIVVPMGASEVYIKSANAIAAYRLVWKDYTAAQDALNALLNSYTNREKLEAEFPELAKYLPDVPEKRKLPMVILQDERKKLSLLGLL